MIVLINQFSTPLFVDVVNAFQEDGREEVRYITGRAEIRHMKVEKGVRVVPSISYKRSTLLTRLITWLAFSIHTGLYLAFCKAPSAVVVVTNPPFAPWVAGFLTRLRKRPLYLVIYDLYPDVLQQAGVMSPRHRVYRLWQRKNPKLFARAQKVITLSDSMKAAIAQYIQGGADKVLVIHNWAAPIGTVGRDRNAFTAEHNLNGKMVVLYAGNMGLTHDLESLMNAAVMLKDNRAIHFVFIGDGGKKKALEGIRDQHLLGNVLFLPYLERDRFTQALAAADVGVVTLGAGAEGISVPSKTYVNMAAGLCLLAIAPEESELAKIVQGHNVGLLTEPGHPARVAESILYLQRHPDALATFKAQSKQASLQFTPRNAYRYVEAVFGNRARDADAEADAGADAGAGADADAGAGAEADADARV